MCKLLWIILVQFQILIHITNTVKSIGYSNNIVIVTQTINLSGKGVNDVNNSISFIPKLGVSVSPPINQVGLIQPNIINNK